ncbi:hypothetical protein PC116_g10835 [Phytophthora cactorum]|nr:hypothetical protein C6341_g8536 [Phytophthora cactorum]KAG3194168.1 hypothetical protein PC128_g9591 [Phytophthora cactorum]KAG4058449.1 hypothetical protein PC123_g6571 [Phytophthora cactorum]KAG4241228.1 hypothetical protein PC116_g10835 [Phytophthora cactorum]
MVTIGWSWAGWSAQISSSTNMYSRYNSAVADVSLFYTLKTTVGKQEYPNLRDSPKKQAISGRLLLTDGFMGLLAWDS